MFHGRMLEHKTRTRQAVDRVATPVHDLNGGVGGDLVCPVVR
jgi:hypothetical protein